MQIVITFADIRRQCKNCLSKLDGGAGWDAQARTSTPNLSGEQRFKQAGKKQIKMALKWIQQMNKIYLRDETDFSSVVIVDHVFAECINNHKVRNNMQLTYVHYVRFIFPSRLSLE